MQRMIEIEVGWRLFGLVLLLGGAALNVYKHHVDTRYAPPPPTPICGDDEGYVRRPGSTRG